MDEYYKKLVKIWDEGGGWGGVYYGVFSKLIKENNLKICAEVGIGYGFHAKEILDNTNVEKLYLIDPSRPYPNDAFSTDVTSNGGFEDLVRNIKVHLKEKEDRYTWFRTPSLEITNEQIPDESLDAVFLDADHSYQQVIRDLPFWWKKIKKGGFLLGDDYMSCHPGCKRAVDDFTKKNKLKIEFLSKENSTQPGYPIYKFIKI